MWEHLLIDLVGRTSYWRRRIRADGRGLVWAAWLRHPTHGTAGIYIPDEQVGDPNLLPDRKQVYARGTIAPLRAVALDDDPRSEDDVSMTPLLLHVQHIDLWDRVTMPQAVPLQEVRVRSPRWIGNGYLAPVQAAFDLSCFAPSMRTDGGICSWNRCRGVLVETTKRRYLRYVLSEESRDQPVASGVPEVALARL